MRRWLILLALIALPVPSAAQDEEALRRFFEGKTVVVKIDMPGSSDGVQVHPTAGMPLDFRELAEDLKDDGIGVHQGESIMITKVHIKGDHIEFQLGGGGFGTFSDALSVSSMGATTFYEGESDREKQLKEEIRHETDPDRKNRMERELNQLREERNRANQEVTRANADAQRQAEQAALEARARSGSRFNIRYNDGYPEGAQTPEGIMAALSEYVEFPFAQAAPSAQAAPAAQAATPASGAAPAAAQAATSAAPGPTSGALKKGLSIMQVEAILGPASSASTEDHDGLEVNVREYTADGQHIRAQFVGGVLIDYAITPAD